MRARIAQGLAIAVAVLVATPAAAQEIADAPSSPASVPGPPGLDQASKQAYWSAGQTRAFLSSTIELGLYYLRPALAAGWGKPHWKWIGVEGQVRISEGDAGEYLGVRLALPFLEARVGSRYTFATSRRFLRPQSAYDRDELGLTEEPRAHYVATEASLTGSVSLLGGKLYALISGHRVDGVPDEFWVFEEGLRVVVDPPWAWRARVGQTIGLGRYDQVQVGAAAEVIGVPDRSDELTVRVGPQLVATLTYHLDVAASAMFVVSSPDSLGLRGSEFSQLGLRYRWATGEPFPDFP